jgi:uncharacterized protein (DUF58 family)
MIHPQNKLTLWAGLVVLPCAALAGLFPGAAVAACLPIAVFVVVAAWDAARGARSAFKVELDFPAVARFSRGRLSALEIGARRAGKAPRRFRLGLALPGGMESDAVERSVELPAGDGKAVISWPCSAWRRGRFSLGLYHLATSSPWALWEIRRAFPARCQVRVYPDLLSDRRAASAVFLRRSGAGVHVFRQVGQGREFEKLREYLPGDGFDEIHWKATARKGRPITKVYQIEKTQEIYVLIDSSRLSGRRTPPPARPEGGPVPARADEFILERFVNAALLLGLAAQKQGDLFGLLTFDDKIGAFLRAGHGLSHFAACREAIHGLMPKEVPPDFGEVFGFIRARLRKRSLLVFLTSLEDPVVAESFLRHSEPLCRQHLVLIISPRPAEAMPLFDPRGKVAGADDIYTMLGGHFRWADLRELGGKLERHGAFFSLPEHEDMSLDIISRYLEIKRRQLI